MSPSVIMKISAIGPWVMQLLIFKLIWRINILIISCRIAASGECHKPSATISQIASDNGLMSWGNKPLTEPMFTKTYVIIWRHLATIISCWSIHMSLLTPILMQNGKEICFFNYQYHFKTSSEGLYKYFPVGLLLFTTDRACSYYCEEISISWFALSK